MKNTILVIAPHPDDETLGLGGTLLRRGFEGHKLFWLIATSMSKNSEWSQKKIDRRKEQIKECTKFYNFSQVYELNQPAAQLDSIPLHILVKKFTTIFQECKPNQIYVPHRGDVHSDHRVIFDVVSSCSKAFRFNFIKQIFAYETLSETNYGLNRDIYFKPNVFVNISDYIDNKIKAINIYEDEMADFPFPRSEKAIRALANLRGSSSGFFAAEAFELLVQRD